MMADTSLNQYNLDSLLPRITQITRMKDAPRYSLSILSERMLVLDYERPVL